MKKLALTFLTILTFTSRHNQMNDFITDQLIPVELDYVYQAIKATKELLNDDIPLIGFAR